MSAPVAATTTQTPARRTRSFEGFDGLRAVASLMIVLHHTGFVSGATFHTHWGWYLTRMDAGVPIFFVISAFLLTRPFVAAIMDGRPLGDRRRFWRRRAIRIFPAYIVATLIILVGHGIEVRGPTGLLFSLTLTHIYHPGRFISGITQSWSLATEISFYAVLPLWAAWMARRLAGRDRNGIAGALLASIAVAFVGSFAFRLAADAALPLRWFTITRYWLPALADLFAWGMALAVVSVWAEHHPLIAEWARSVARHWAVCWVSAGVLFWFVSTQLGLERGLVVSSLGREIFRQTIYGLIGMLLVAPLALRTNERTPLVRVLAWRPIAFVGLVSYGVYLWHQYVLKLVGDAMGWELFSDHFWGLLVPTVAGSTLIGWISYRFLERPLLDARFARSR